MLTRHSDKGEKARQSIVLEAEALFAARGLHGTTVREIALAIDRPTASLLHYFPTKERLYGAVLSAIAADLDQLIAASLARAGTFEQKLRRICDSFIGWSEDDPQRSNLLLRELLDNPGRLEQAEQLHLRPVLDRMIGFIEAGQKAGAFRAVDPVLFVVHLAGSASYMRAARPTLERILGNKRTRGLSKRHHAELIALMERALLREDEDR